MINLNILKLIGVILVSSIIGSTIMFYSIKGKVVKSEKKIKELQAELTSSSSCTDIFIDGNGELFYIEHIKEGSK